MAAMCALGVWRTGTLHTAAMCAQGCVEDRGGQCLLSLSRVCLNSFLSYFEGQRLSLNLELTSSVRLAGHEM